jgi:hypothetical protein
MSKVKFLSLRDGDHFEVYGNEYLGRAHSKVCDCIKVDWQTGREVNGPEFLISPTDFVMLPGTGGHKDVVDFAVAQMTETISASVGIKVPDVLPINPNVADDLRAQGLMVAVHNDYRLGGVHHTFWLFVDEATGMSYKGEGLSDIEALNQVREKYTNRER